jgi:hypothetical protein
MAYLERKYPGRRIDVGATVENASVAPRPAPQIDPEEFDASLVELLKTRRRQLADAPPAHPAPPLARPGH